jgi:hypothetical protein
MLYLSLEQTRRIDEIKKFVESLPDSEHTKIALNAILTHRFLPNYRMSGLGRSIVILKDAYNSSDTPENIAMIFAKKIRKIEEKPASSIRNSHPIASLLLEMKAPEEIEEWINLMRRHDMRDTLIPYMANAHSLEKIKEIEAFLDDKTVSLSSIGGIWKGQIRENPSFYSLLMLQVFSDVLPAAGMSDKLCKQVLFLIESLADPGMPTSSDKKMYEVALSLVDCIRGKSFEESLFLLREIQELIPIDAEAMNASLVVFHLASSLAGKSFNEARQLIYLMKHAIPFEYTRLPSDHNNMQARAFLIELLKNIPNTNIGEVILFLSDAEKTKN